MNFEFSTANRIIFGPGTISEIGTVASKIGRKIFLVTGQSSENRDTLRSIIAGREMHVCTCKVGSEPTIQSVTLAVDMARDCECDLVIGIGGGSVIDTAKAVASLMTNRGSVLDYVEVVGRGKKLIEPSVPCIIVPTTSGTGSEVTRNSVITSSEHRVKVSLRSNFLLPDTVIIDPELTRSMPPSLTSTCGMDALTQLIESYVSNGANPLTDAISRKGVEKAARSLLRAYNNGNDMDAREDMALASLFSGLALANSKLGAVHGFAGPLGGMFDAPHGAVCARLLPNVMMMNVQALRERGEKNGCCLHRFDEVAGMLTGDSEANASDGASWISRLCAEMNIPGLSEFGIEERDFPEIIRKAQNSSSMKGNPVRLDESEMNQILQMSL